MKPRLSLIRSMAGLLLLGPGGMSACLTRTEEPIPQLWEAPPFSLLNFDGRTVAADDLRGKNWVGAFIFTRCPGPCPLISQRMKEIQSKMNPDANRLVSFTVDPEFDTPAILQSYSRLWSQNADTWFFLTSENPADITAVAEGFKVASSRIQPEPGEVPDITHGTHLFVVDRRGMIRAFVGSSSPASVQQVLDLLDRLGREENPLVP